MLQTAFEANLAKFASPDFEFKHWVIHLNSVDTLLSAVWDRFEYIRKEDAKQRTEASLERIRQRAARFGINPKELAERHAALEN